MTTLILACAAYLAAYTGGIWFIVTRTAENEA